MTTLKTPEDVSHEGNGQRVTTIITQDRQAIATLLCELLEGEKRPMKPSMYGTLAYTQKDWEYNLAIEKAQAIIRQTLDLKQE